MEAPCHRCIATETQGTSFFFVLVVLLSRFVATVQSLDYHARCCVNFVTKGDLLFVVTLGYSFVIAHPNCFACLLTSLHFSLLLKYAVTSEILALLVEELEILFLMIANVKRTGLLALIIASASPLNPLSCETEDRECPIYLHSVIFESIFSAGNRFSYLKLTFSRSA